MHGRWWVAASLMMVLVGCAPAKSSGGNETTCGSAQVNLAVDSANCGACGNACAAGSRCVASKCALTCGTGAVVCGNACTDVRSDSSNCGACGNACGDDQRCVAGQCATACGANGISCTQAGKDVCVDANDDPANCGSCGHVCAPQHVTGAACHQGSCGYAACEPGYTDCDGDPSNGCESPTAQCVRLISVGMDGGAANGDSWGAATDRSGTKVVFISSADNLVPGDTNGATDVFLRDLASGTTRRLSTLPDGGEIPGDAGASYISAAISGDGKVMAISTNAPLLDLDTNGSGSDGYDVVVFEADGGRSYGMLSNSGAQPSSPTETFGVLSLSEDGRLVTYHTRATNLFTANNGGGRTEANVFQYDRQASGATTTTCATLDYQGDYVTGGFDGFNAFLTSVSSNGRYIGWNSLGFSITQNESNDSCGHAFLTDTLTGTVREISLVDTGAPMSCNGYLQNLASGVAAAADGTSVVYSTANDPVSAAYVGTANVWARDLRSGTSGLVSVGLDGGANADAYAPSVSDDTGRLTFLSTATNLVPSGTDGVNAHCFLVDRAAGTLSQLNAPIANPSVDGGTGCLEARISSSGHTAVFESRDALVPQDRNEQEDVYLRQLP